MSTNSERRLEPIIEQFRSLQSEIDIRVKQHTQLVLFKIVSIGAIASFVLSSDNESKIVSPSMELLIWAVPLVSIAFDMLIAQNLRMLFNIGPFIKRYIEPIFRRESFDDAQFWEETVATTPSAKYHGYKVDDMIVTWTFTATTSTVSVLVAISRGLIWWEWICLGFVVIGAIFALRKLIQSVTMDRDFGE